MSDHSSDVIQLSNYRKRHDFSNSESNGCYFNFFELIQEDCAEAVAYLMDVDDSNHGSDELGEALKNLAQAIGWLQKHIENGITKDCDS